MLKLLKGLAENAGDPEERPEAEKGEGGIVLNGRLELTGTRKNSVSEKWTFEEQRRNTEFITVPAMKEDHRIPVPADRTVVQQGTIVGESFQIVKRLGKGSFGECWLALTRDPHGQKYAAVKFVTGNKQSMETETKVLKAMGDRRPGYSPTFLGSISDGGEQIGFAMSALSKDLEEIRLAVGGKVGDRRAGLIGIGIVRALQALHSIGIVHQDVKLSNCALGVGPGNMHRAQLLDFGLAQDYVSKGEKGRKAGTTAYMSLRAHAGHAQGPYDDLWSCMMAVHLLIMGDLPWDPVGEVEQIVAAKKASLPHLLDDRTQIPKELGSSKLAIEPNYDWLSRELRRVFAPGTGDNSPLRWLD